MARYLSISFTIILFAGLSYSATINVPADQSTIQAGIDAAVDGDTVLVAPGTYKENLSILNNSVFLVSSDGPSTTNLEIDFQDDEMIDLYILPSHKIGWSQTFGSEEINKQVKSSEIRISYPVAFRRKTT